MSRRGRLICRTKRDVSLLFCLGAKDPHASVSQIAPAEGRDERTKEKNNVRGYATNEAADPSPRCLGLSQEDTANA